jgi:hypothetical protein
MGTITNIDDLLEKLEADAPDVYIKCIASFPDKNGNKKEKKCIINLTTGDVFKNRKLEEHEAFNHRIIRKFGNGITPDISHFAYQCAQVVDNQVVLTTWIFGDYINQPGTAHFDYTWYNDTNVDGAPRRHTDHPEALFNIVMSEPKIAAIVTVSRDRKVETWEDLNKYGLNNHGCRWAHNEYLTASLLRALRFSYDTKRVVGISECFKKVFEIGYVGANKYLTFDSHKDVAEFMKATNPQIKNCVAQKRIDELTNIPLPDHSTVPMLDKTICYADRVNDEWTVLRWSVNVGPSKFVETSRLYVNKTEALHCRSDLNGHWIYAAAKLKAKTFNADRVILQYPCVLDRTKLEYFKNISADMSNQSAALYMLTMYPEFEKMYKIGLDWLCDTYLKSTWQQSWKNYLEAIVGQVDWTAKNVFKMIGANHHQIEKINEWRKSVIAKAQNSPYAYWSTRSVDSIIGKLRRVFGTTPMSDIDNETFDYIIDSITYVRLMSMYIPALQKTFEVYPKDAMYFIRDLNSVDATGEWTITTTTEYGYNAQMNVDRLYFDTLQMINLGAYMDRIRPRFSTTDELVGHHQILIDLANAEQAEHEARVNARYESGFQTNHKRWEKWAWDGDDEFCVIAPSKPVDVAVEGITLRHCVKSYIPSVSAGTTNIMFIRRKGKEEEPFFTVEVDSAGSIRQVHGMCNCNVSSVEGLTEFVRKWSKLKKLRYNETFANGRRVARG